MNIRQVTTIAITLLLAAMMVTSCALPGSQPPAATQPPVAQPTATQAPKDLPAAPPQPTATAIKIVTATNAPAAPTSAFTATPTTLDRRSPTAPAPTNTPAGPTATRVPPSATPGTAMTAVPQDMAAKIANAKILVYDSAYGSKTIIPRVDKALASLGLTGANVTHRYDASGLFWEDLKNTSGWDLIIMNAEDRNSTRFGIWEDVKKHVDAKTALLLEVWYLDQISDSQITPLLNQCGIGIMGNWRRKEPIETYKYQIFPYDASHPVWNTPNKIETPLKLYWVWTDDVGDLYNLTPGSKATLLAGPRLDDRTRYGLLASCYDGRVLMQGFSTHDYDKDITIKLWANYIVYTLTNHFKALP
ncbi:MAG TPA: hypothetical protein VIO61_08190 [Anaerolineaceae bacterium]